MNSSLFFYNRNKLVTLKQDNQHQTIFRNAEQLLAELCAASTRTIGLTATDDKGSVLVVQSSDEQP